MYDRESDQREAMKAVDPILPTLYQIVDDAVTFYFGGDYSNAARADHDDRAMANCIYSHAEKRMISAADEFDGLSLLTVKGLRILNYKDVVLARVKKTTPYGLHSNYQTSQQQQYDNQESFSEFPEPAFRLTVGYHLDASGVELERILIARPLGRDIFWSVQVTMTDDAAKWEDITPKRLAGTEGSDFDAQRARRQRER